MMQGGSLLWCAHHFAFFEDALNAFGALVLSHLLGELWAGRGVPGWSALGVWLSVVVMVAVAGVLDVSFKRRNWLSRLLDVAEQEVDSAGCRGHRVVDQRLALGTAQRSDRSV
ncbi:MAG TPA: hypothetical protein VIJ07_13900, partial [Dermatophilaceae bacterium]